MGSWVFWIKYYNTLFLFFDWWMMKKILIVTPFFAPAYSYWWIVKVAYDQAVWLVKKWFDVTVVTTDVFDAKNRNKVLEEKIDWIKIIRFKNISNYLAKFQNLHLPIWMKKWLKDNIKWFKIVHIHDIYNYPTFWAMKYAYSNWIKYYIQPHGTLSDIRIKSRKSWIKKWILNKMKNYFDNAHWLFALTQNEVLEIKNITDNKNIFELPNWLYLDKFKNTKPFDIHKKYNLNKNIKIITFLWRIQYIKWLDISLKVLSKLNEKFQDWRFLVIWPNEWEKNKLIELSEKLWIKDKIIWYWLENTDKKYQLLAWSDLFLFNSRNEWFPMTVLEAIACKLPVLISKWCNLLKIWEYKAWEIVDNEDMEICLSKMKILLENKVEYLKWGEKLLWEEYDLDVIIERLGVIYR